MNQNKPIGPFRIYWDNYGRWKALFASGYFWTSLVLTVVCYRLWSKDGWWDDIIAIVPSLVGFSLAAFAMLLAFTNEKFLKIVTFPIPGNDPAKPGASVYASTGTAFVHFILIQFIALLSALVCKAFFTEVPPWLAEVTKQFGLSIKAFVCFTHVFWFLAYWCFLYSILSGVAATMRVFMLAYWFNKVAEKDSQPKAPQ
jgi:hypothetical protein